MNQHAWTLAQNPYNFVAEDPAADSIRFAAPRLNQHQGQTGVLHCSLELLTPLFIRGRQIKLDDQHIFDPFEINSKPAIPASSLRGAVRSIYETITQSCFSVFFKPEERLHIRMNPSDANKLRAGKIIAMPNGAHPGRIKRFEKAWVAQNRNGEQVYETRHSAVHIASIPPKAASGTEYKGRIIEIPERYTRRRDRWVRQPGPFKLMLSVDESDDAKEGVLKITGNNLRDNHDRTMRKRERFFYPVAPEECFEFGEKEVKEYNEILKAQLETLDSQPGQFEIRERHELDAGSLVYFRQYGSNAKDISRVEVPRVFFENSPYDLLSETQKPCEHLDQLCAGCRLWGFVSKTDALASRIAFTDAVTSTNEYELYDSYLPLKPLSSPHPTMVNLYLKNVNDINTIVCYDDDEAALRGRKFYFRYPFQTADALFSHAKASGTQKYVIKNSPFIKPVVRGMFGFDIHFDHLEDWELGGLIYSLELEGDMRQMIGLAKPLGFGQCKLSIDSADFISKQHFKTLKPALSGELNKSDLVRCFKEKIKQLSGKSFDDLKNIQQLKKICSPLTLSDPVPAYPEPEGFRNYRDIKRNNMTLNEL